MTAVDFLVEQITNSTMPVRIAIEKAKEMEKQQIIESYCQGCFDIIQDENIFPRETAEQYYNETFKSE
jgi:hypothetical protein